MKTQYITDSTGKKVSVILPIRDYEHILEQLEELEDIKSYDQALKNSEDAIPAQEAFKEIEARRNDL